MTIYAILHTGKQGRSVAIAPYIAVSFKYRVPMEHTQQHCFDERLVAVETLLGPRNRSFVRLRPTHPEGIGISGKTWLG